MSVSRKLSGEKRGTLQDQCVKIALDDGILHARHGKLEEVRVGCIRKMYIDLAIYGSIETLEFVGEVVCCGLEIVGCSGVVGEVVADWFLGDLLFEEIGLVEEEDD